MISSRTSGNSIRHIFIGVFFPLFFVNSFFVTKAEISGQTEECTYTFSGRFRPEWFWATCANWLNKKNKNDQVLFWRGTLDANLDVVCGNKLLKQVCGEFFCTIRNKSVWGNSGSIARTTESETRFLDGIVGAHSHAIPRHVVWLREIWLQFKPAKAFGIGIDDSHVITLGAFPFQVGRGIALGDAYAVGSELLGFYVDNIIDQYAFGMMIDGDILTNFIHYAFYFGLLQNKSASISDTTQKIRLKERGHFNSPERGFGRINFVTAAKFDTTLLSTKNKKVLIQPYVLYAHDPEQKVEFEADAQSHLGTVGLSGEFFSPIFECGFDTAVNVGRQNVRGWDRNKIDSENQCGQIRLVNTQVLNAADGSKIPFVPGSETQNIIIASNGTCFTAADNGQTIGQTSTPPCFNPSGNVTLKNSDTRFRDAYTNTYRGWMAVIDGMVWFCEKQVGCAGTAGLASGDENPNINPHDSTYKGFIPLQEMYSGKRVKSAFLMGSAGKVGRTLSIPNPVRVASSSNYARAVSGFTNIGFVGIGGHWGPREVKKPFSIKPNLLFYWQYNQVPKFDALTQKQLCGDYASRYLGAELNLFADMTMFKNLKGFAVVSVFFPGKHFSDVKGKPLNAEQAKELDRISKLPNFIRANIPNIGDDIAYTCNIGFEIYF